MCESSSPFQCSSRVASPVVWLCWLSDKFNDNDGVYIHWAGLLDWDTGMHYIVLFNVLIFIQNTFGFDTCFGWFHWKGALD